MVKNTDGQFAVWTAFGAIIGAAAVSLFDLSIEDRFERLGSCVTYRVSNQAITSYVMKPPTPEPASCQTQPFPEREVKADKASLAQESPAPAEEVAEKEGDKPRRHYRRHHYRVRRYWR